MSSGLGMLTGWIVLLGRDASSTCRSYHYSSSSSDPLSSKELRDIQDKMQQMEADYERLQREMEEIQRRNQKEMKEMQRRNKQETEEMQRRNQQEMESRMREIVAQMMRDDTFPYPRRPLTIPHP